MVLTSGDRAVARTYVLVLVLLRESLSSNDSAFAKLVRQGKPDLTNEPALPQVISGKMGSYRQLSATDLKELCTSYEAGESMAKLAQKFECHRHTVMRQLEKAGVPIRPQKKMTNDLVAQAAAFYANGHTLEDIGNLLGLDGGTMRQST